MMQPFFTQVYSVVDTFVLETDQLYEHLVMLDDGQQLKCYQSRENKQVKKHLWQVISNNRP